MEYFLLSAPEEWQVAAPPELPSGSPGLLASGPRSGSGGWMAQGCTSLLRGELLRKG